MQIIKKQFEENEEVLLLVDIDWEQINVSDTYDNYGQQISSSDAGDSITLNSLKAVKIWSAEFDEYEENPQAIGESISAYDYPTAYEEIITTLIENEDFTYHRETVTGFNYWNGQNHKTITIATPNGEPTHEVLEGAGYQQMIAEYENTKFLSESFGLQTFLGENFVYSKSSFADDFEIAAVETIADFEERKEVATELHRILQNDELQNEAAQKKGWEEAQEELRKQREAAAIEINQKMLIESYKEQEKLRNEN